MMAKIPPEFHTWVTTDCAWLEPHNVKILASPGMERHLQASCTGASPRRYINFFGPQYKAKYHWSWTSVLIQIASLTEHVLFNRRYRNPRGYFSKGTCANLGPSLPLQQRFRSILTIEVGGKVWFFSIRPSFVKSIRMECSTCTETWA